MKLVKIIKPIKYMTKEVMPFAAVAWLVYSMITGDVLDSQQKDAILVFILLVVSQNLKL